MIFIAFKISSLVCTNDSATISISFLEPNSKSFSSFLVIEPSEQLAIFSEGFKNVRLCERFLKS